MRRTTIIVMMLTLIFGTTTLYAQPLDKGQKIADATFTDVNGKKFSLKGYMDQGYTLVIDLSATWCSYCWQLHKTNLLQKLYNQYGPNGTIEKKKIMPIFIEADPATSRDDLYGKGQRTLGNWVQGKSFHIVDIESLEEIRGLTKGGVLSLPVLMVVCSDGTVLMSNSGFDHKLTDEVIYNEVKAECKGGATSIDDITTPFSVNIFPNPVTDYLNLNLNGLEGESDLTITIMDVSGRIISQEDKNVFSGAESIKISTMNLIEGVYIIKVGNRNMGIRNLRFVKY